MEVAKHLMVRAFDEVENFYGRDLIAKVQDNGVLHIKEKDQEDCLGVFNRWDYVRKINTS